MRILTARGHTNRTRPIVIKEAQLVAKPLHYIWREIRVVVHHNHMRRRNGALAHALRYEEEVIQATPRHCVIKNDARVRIIDLVAAFFLKMVEQRKK